MDDSSANSPVRTGSLKKAFSTLLAGVASVIPILATLWILVLIYKILGQAGDGIIGGLYDFLNQIRGMRPADPGYWRFEFPGSEFLRALLPVLIVFSIGFAVTNSLGRHILQWVEGKFERIPVIGFLFSSIQQLMEAIKGMGSERNFKGVAFVEYPSPGCRLVGFVTGSFFDTRTGKEVTSVFLPTAPNPLTGFVVLMDNERITMSDMTLEEASKLILSAGLVAPAPETDGSLGGLRPVADPSEKPN
ncbi:putative membrane protein [Haloferula luteola]|uniref:Putative membrane protein n=1 Tax=Haloferula luteola TaxID=595692 RepID=A0A840V6U1_9BACT|nr:DUF502 domain-containing protein [Haloferula luteola]MBB5351324.1 putative membrane protein [Haloferula luteola]